MCSSCAAELNLALLPESLCPTSPPAAKQKPHPATTGAFIILASALLVDVLSLALLWAFPVYIQIHWHWSVHPSGWACFPAAFQLIILAFNHRGIGCDFLFHIVAKSFWCYRCCYAFASPTVSHTCGKQLSHHWKLNWGWLLQISPS